MANWTLANADIVSALPKLANHQERADSGTINSLICERLKGLNKENIVGAIICFLTGASFGIDATITDYDTETGEITFTPIENAVTSSTVFGIVYFDFNYFVNRAYDIIKNDIRNGGLDVDLFLDTTQVKELHLTKALELVCLAKRQDADDTDLYHASYLIFVEKYIKELASLRADYDVNEDGTITDDEKDLKTNYTFLDQ